jgi:dephospho-CoA kinase
MAIVLSGELGAGKSAASVYISDAFGFERLSFVEAIWKPILRERGIEPTRSALQTLGIELVSTTGIPGLVDQLLASRKSNRVVIDDARRPDVVEAIRARIDNVFHVHILSSFDTRYKRLVVRDGVRSEEEQHLAESVETELTIASMQSIADAVIANDATLPDYQSRITKVLDEAHFS